MSTTSNQVGKHVKNVTDDLQKMAGTVRDAAQEKLGQVGERASECREQGRDRVHGVACRLRAIRPAKAAEFHTLAAGVGLLFGRFWLRR